MENTKISWCDHTYNPWIGCTKISPACDNCYAENIAKRFFRDVQWGSHDRRKTGAHSWRQVERISDKSAANIRAWMAVKETNPGITDAEIQKRGFIKPIIPRIFCGSMCDIFDNHVPKQWRSELFEGICTTFSVNWLILTKRIGNVLSMCCTDRLIYDMLYDRCWLGITVCDQKEADRDIPKLLESPAHKRFLSLEPLLASVNLSTYLNHIDWVIVGGETGPKSRPMSPVWVLSIRDQCQAAGVPFFFKQWGAKKSGRLLDGVEYSEFPE